MNVTALLCDAAQSVGGKLYILGGGWSQVLVPGFPLNMAIAVKLEIPWHQANDPHKVVARLVDGQTGDQFSIGGEEGNEAVEVRQEVEVETGRPPGLAPGTDLDAPLVFTFAGLPLPTGSFVWEIEVDGAVEARIPVRVGPVQRR